MCTKDGRIAFILQWLVLLAQVSVAEWNTEHRWTARDREVTARRAQYLDDSDSLKVAVLFFQ